jgi:hypothetical protein
LPERTGDNEMSDKAAYGSVLVKVSGEMLGGGQGSGFKWWLNSTQNEYTKL